MTDIQIAKDAIGRLQSNFVAAATATPPDEGTLNRLQADCRILLNWIDELLGADWLAAAKLDYDLNTYIQQGGQIPDFRDFLKLMFQQELDNSSNKGYTIVKFDLIEQQPAGSKIFRASAFLSPSARKKGPGGGGGTTDPGYPPRR